MSGKDAKKILIVEDERPLRIAIEDKLKNEGFHVESAINGDEGIKSAIQNQPDLIILDILMPRKDGLSMLEDLRKNPYGKTIPVIILTNLSDSKIIGKGLNLNANNYLVKSETTLEEIVIRVKDLLNNFHNPPIPD